MKPIFTSLALAFTVVSASSCTDSNHLNPTEVPAAVMSSFNSKYTNVTDAEWEKEEKSGATVYEVEFKANNKEIKALFDANGGLLESKGD